jgi:hypothetical protein
MPVAILTSGRPDEKELTMSWFGLALIMPTTVVLYYLFKLLVAPPPKPRWKVMFLCSSLVVLDTLPRVVRTDAPVDDAAAAWLFLIFGTIGVIVAVFAIRPHGDQLMQ